MLHEHYASLGHPGTMLHEHFAVLGHFGADLGRLGPSCGRLGTSWGVLGASWRVLGASWGVLGASWARLGGVLGSPKRGAQLCFAEGVDAIKMIAKTPSEHGVARPILCRKKNLDFIVFPLVFQAFFVPR